MPTDPASLEIVHYPAPVLRVKGEEIDEINDEVRAVAERMVELMHQAEGIGLAAPQVGLSWRMFVVHVPEDPSEPGEPGIATFTHAPMVYINPRLSDPERDLVPGPEGCLSLPQISGDVPRPSRITITAQDLDGNEFTQRASGLLARCWQHEHDHLDGVLILDRMTRPSRMKNRNAVRDLERIAGML